MTRNQPGRLPTLAVAGVLATAPAAWANGQDRVLAEIRQIQAQLAEVVESNRVLTEAITALRSELDRELESSRRDRAESSNSLSRMDRGVSVIRESLAETNDRLSGLMAEVEEIRRSQSRAVLQAAAVPETPEPETTAAEDEEMEVEPDAEAAPAAEVLEGPSVSDLFLEARADYLQGRYALAISGFEQVIEIGGELADNAVYFLGEAMLAEERLEDALSQFETLIEDFPESDQAPDAWYKKGYILERLGNRTDAQEIYQDILDVFAGTQAALAAERQLESLLARDPGS